jgi:hypothetical protein
MRGPASGLAAALIAGAAGAWAGVATRPSIPEAEGPVWRLRAQGLVYRFHATFRAEALFDAAADPRETRDLAPDRPDDVAALRATFLAYMRRDSLASVPSSMEDWRRGLEALGYLGGGEKR